MTPYKDWSEKVSQDAYTLGSLGAKVENLEESMRLVNMQLASINKTLSEAKGGWKTLLLIAGMASVLGAFLAKLMPWITFAPR